MLDVVAKVELNVKRKVVALGARRSSAENVHLSCLTYPHSILLQLPLPVLRSESRLLHIAMNLLLSISCRNHRLDNRADADTARHRCQ